VIWRSSIWPHFRLPHVERRAQRQDTEHRPRHLDLRRRLNIIGSLVAGFRERTSGGYPLLLIHSLDVNHLLSLAGKLNRNELVEHLLSSVSRHGSSGHKLRAGRRQYAACGVRCPLRRVTCTASERRASDLRLREGQRAEKARSFRHMLHDAGWFLPGDISEAQYRDRSSERARIRPREVRNCVGQWSFLAGNADANTLNFRRFPRRLLLR
jgi:hypothetical protein